VQTHDGVGVACRGNLVLVFYGADARLHRTRWIFDRVDEVAARNPGGIYSLMAIIPNSAPPDAATRAENAKRFGQLDRVLIAMVTVALGDDFRVSIVRTLMRASILLSRQSGKHLIASTECEGIDRLLAEAAGDTRLPSRSLIEGDLATLRRKLVTHATAAEAR
jgi:hypothetical protein